MGTKGEARMKTKGVEQGKEETRKGMKVVSGRSGNSELLGILYGFLTPTAPTGSI